MHHRTDKGHAMNNLNFALLGSELESLGRSYVTCKLTPSIFLPQSPFI